MKKILFINILIFFLLLLLLNLCLNFLNHKFAGVPIYDKLKIDRNQLTNIKSNTSKIDNKFIPLHKNLKINAQYVNKCGFQESGVYHAFYTPDMYGFQDNDNTLYSNSDIIMIGDSFGISSCVNPPHTMKSQLEILSKKKILNLSVQGTGPITQMKIVTKYAANTNFNTLVWFYYEGNDWGEILLSIDNDLFKKETHINNNLLLDVNLLNTESGINLLTSQKEVMVDYEALLTFTKQNDKEQIINHKWQNEKLVKLKIYLAEKFKGLNSLIKYFKKYPELNGQQEYEKSVKLMRNFLENKSVKKRYIYYLPQYSRLAQKIKTHPELKNLNKQKKFIKFIANKYNFEFIDGAEFLYNRNNPLDIFHYYLPTHYNEHGYKLISKHLYKIISN